jgi:hypothetical protein
MEGRGGGEAQGVADPPPKKKEECKPSKLQTGSQDFENCKYKDEGFLERRSDVIFFLRILLFSLFQTFFRRRNFLSLLLRQGAVSGWPDWTI